MYRFIVSTLLFATSFLTHSASNVILVTLDGIRWQETFNGIDKALYQDPTLVKNSAQLEERYWHERPEMRRQKLMPFFWNTIAKHGTLIGDRTNGSFMSVANEWYFSYPGYNEILTGKVDPSINSNAFIANHNVTFLEWLNKKPKYQSKLAAFGSWAAFDAIFNETRSGLYVNDHNDAYQIQPQSPEMDLLNALQAQTPSPWQEVRQDSFTYRFAKDYLIHIQPRAMVIALGETDDFAHDGHYDRYIAAIHRTDQYLADLWQTLQSIPKYRNNTVMLIVTDHGRGYHKQDWQHHASKQAVQGYMKKLANFENGIIGANEIWLAAIGPRIAAQGVLKTSTELKQDQVAATILTLLGENYLEFDPTIGKPIKEMLIP
ncbi:hypothetical protein PALB_24760 [Pseudoalteromonas luteoviolacea B = ATCC 29581]|nr:hypothetical protein PALB_24760 [Pseudoalteromonas luteoviolacea B = ATCC 29581]